MTAEDERAAVVAGLKAYRARLIARERRALEGAVFHITLGGENAKD